METIKALSEALMYVLPALVLVLVVYVVLHQLVRKERLREEYMMRTTAYQTVLPLKLAAYERALLFLERISPFQLIPRLDGNQKSAKAFQSQLLQEIRSEFEHNIAQQLYISFEAWDEVIQAKEETIALINQCAKGMSQNSTGLDLSKAVFESIMKLSEPPGSRAIVALKKDVQKLFR